jgi:uncharacterized protein YkuJ
MIKLELEVLNKKQLLEILNRLTKLKDHELKTDEYSIELDGEHIGKLTVRGVQ